MHKSMLIDTTHAEETRVVIMDGDRLEDYDIETSSKKQIKGNIYLAKVIRVEPSLQAAFVDYGGNRHGFLAFSEIHPDYFQIPVADREQLLALQEEDLPSEDAQAQDEDAEELNELASSAADDEDDNERRYQRFETVGGEQDTGDESMAARRMARFLRAYKIQEVIRRRQILLVQVTKEERGNKGAALTTYVSLAGRYCVLMPNALRGGGISRKITSEADRRRLRDVITELQLPRGMAMIVRTAGAQRPGAEITRDCEYLLQLWDDIREHTLASVAPSLIHEEASLIKRAIRDLFSKDINEIVIDGEAAWKGAREFMRLLMPHNVNRVKLWRSNGQSLFARHRVERHLEAIFSPTATLKSGGYIVINQTEALVAIDVNSGRSTSQRNIEDTALRTNLEAAEEVARQLRLRDLAGLIVIDFIDMESRRHNHMVEKRLKEALRSDRARIQLGQISHFGLLEMSRQRLRSSIAEAVLTPCTHCHGTGYIRGTESAALQALRTIDEEGLKRRAAEITVHASTAIALYILNKKRDWLAEIEQRHGMKAIFLADDSLTASEVRIERTRAPETLEAPQVADDDGFAQATIEEMETPFPEEERNTAPFQEDEQSEPLEEGRRRRRRRRRGGRRNDETQIEGGGERPQTTSSEEIDPAITQPHSDRARQASLSRSGRRVPQNAPLQERQAPPALREEVGQNRSASVKVEPLWNGPTPADPFRGTAFDIFETIENVETQESVIPQKSERGAQRHLQSKADAEESSPLGRQAPNAGRSTTAPQRKRGRPRKTALPETTPIEHAQDADPRIIAQEVVPPPAAPATSEAAPRRRGRPRKEETLSSIDEATSGAKSPRGARSKKVKAPAAETNAPVIQPIDVDEVKPSKRRTGWWQR